jgi:N-acylneuraminate cytidylyltransferase
MTKPIIIIPARGGSKRIPKKNIKSFLGEPIIRYPIQELLGSNLFETIYVSTDDHEIARISESYGAIVPNLRPQKLADDYTTTVDVIGNEIINLGLQNTEGLIVCCVYPTTPLLNSKDLEMALGKLMEGTWDYVVSALKLDFAPDKTFALSENGRIVLRSNGFESVRTQDLNQYYKDAGQFYCGWATSWGSFKPIFSSQSTIYEIESKFIVDIDTFQDWERAELYYKMKEDGVDN